MTALLVVAVRLLQSAFLVLVFADLCCSQSADDSLIFSTANEWMKENGKPMTTFAQKIGLRGLAINPSLQAAEGVGMLVVKQIPAMQAARAVFRGTEIAGQFARGIAMSASGSHIRE